MAKRKAKPATAGEKIANTVYHEGTMTDALLSSALSRRINRAIARAVRKERDRCSAIAKRGFDGDIDPSDVWVEIVNGVTP